jgi:hypothetical protein
MEGKSDLLVQNTQRGHKDITISQCNNNGLDHVVTQIKQSKPSVSNDCLLWDKKLSGLPELTPLLPEMG